MAKKQPLVPQEEDGRKTRKEILLERRHQRQMKRVRLAIGSVLGLIALVVVIALINEYLIVPSRPVAVVNEESISLTDWQDRVRYERAQRIVFLENQYDAFNGDVGIIQQFAGQTIMEVFNAEDLGQTVLNALIEEAVIRQAAEARGIVVTDADVEQEIAESFNFFGGDSPPPTPTATATVMPTPSVTPITTEVITETEVLPPPETEVGPTNTPRPTPTAVSAEAFQQEFNEFLDQFRPYGITEAQYRSIVRAQLFRERLAEWLAQDQDLTTTADHVSFYVIIYDTEEDANEGQAMIEAEGFLPVWNAIRSAPPDPENLTQPFATELPWQTQDELTNNIGFALATEVFSLPLNTPSDIVTEQLDPNAPPRYFIMQVSGREERPLSPQALENARLSAVRLFVDSVIASGGVEITDNWRGRTPTQPSLDPKFLQQPTPAPQQELPPELPPIEELPPLDDGQ